MSSYQPTVWLTGHWPLIATAAALLTLAAGICALIVRRTSGAVFTAGVGALVCTAYSGDTSWNFARDHLGMTRSSERIVMFAAGEIALLACAVMARANKRATATATAAGTPGVPGVLVWCITGIQIIPAYSESGVWGGTVRAVIGPVMAGLLWHLAMGLEIRISRPEALSTGLPAQIGHELRERLLSYLGLAVRGRTAAQVTRDRATARAVRLASRRWLSPWGRAALKASVARSGAATDPAQRHRLLQLLAARRNAGLLQTVPVDSPWVDPPVPEAYPATPLGVAGAELRRMDPLDAVLQVHAARPSATPAEVASLCTEYGVPVSETQVRVALHALPKTPGTALPAPAAHPGTPAPTTLERPHLTAVPEPATRPVPDPPVPAYPGTGLHLDVTTEPEVRREHACAVPADMIRPRRTRTEVHARVPDPTPGLEHAFDFIRRRAAEERAAAPRTSAPPEVDPGTAVPEVHPDPVPAGSRTGDDDDFEDLLTRARQVDADHRRTHRRPASIQTLKTTLRIGQAKAQLLRNALADPNRKAG
ncbi:hypothetical protein [Streptomyces longwoodensis]|uniref:hypothetical protein n=1 Tax=Streptomyces longwoodensis TaxID=68231 RepID=UPI00224DD3AF|nr:hypothetical protein [Streptomyces longwoodensis]MCX4993830.1 hypothetical protein [Streptomyces longwoodensis]MCX4998050.1 hypothetical protein [Streptomyces longwoodensis]